MIWFKFFVNNCVKNERLQYTYAAIEPIYKLYSEEYPQWHLSRYYTKNLRILDHIYHCLRKGSTKEMLYKAGLDELAVYIDEMDEINLLSSKPSDLYEGVSMRTLRVLNCRHGAMLLSNQKYRDCVRNLQIKFPDLFKEKFNDAMCRYLMRLIDSDLTIGEVGRLLRARKLALLSMWAPSQYELFLMKEKTEEQNRKIMESISAIDPIYKTAYEKEQLDQNDIANLKYFLLINRENLDKKIRRANRRRKYDWQERNQGYVVRYPQTINDFCREAIYMNNCLMGYVEAFYENNTEIIFIRENDDVNTPFITMEVQNGELMQAYHRFNMDCTDEEANWIRDYCDRHGIGRMKFQFDSARDQLF